METAATVTHPAPNVKQLMRAERRLFAASDDTAMRKQILATHAPDGREADIKPILQIIEHILNRATSGIDGVINGTHALVHTVEDKTGLAGSEGTIEALAFTIQKIACEISCKCTGGGDAHATTMILLNTLSGYSWDAKVVLALAAFAVNYGEFWLVAKHYTTDSLAKSVALLKQLPDILEHAKTLKPQFDALTTLIKAMMNVTKCIVQFQEVPSQYIAADTPAMSVAMAHIPTATYWTARSVVACALQIASLVGLRHEYVAVTSEAWELSSLAHKLSSIHEHLKKQLALCYQHIDEKKQIEAYHNLVRHFETLHMDNIKLLKVFIYPKDDQPPLFDCNSKSRTPIDVLRRKHVLLLISDLDISNEEIAILDLMYQDSRANPELQYEVVWLPILDRSTPLSENFMDRFEALKTIMPWYTIYNPTLIEPASVRYIKEVWRFSKKSILVPLDPQGRVLSQNAFHMLWIWGNYAFPFSNEKEETLWKLETWRIDLLVDGIDDKILKWIEEDSYMCLYGGEDLNWIKNFTDAAKDVAGAAGITLKMVYVGKSNAKERVKKITDDITRSNISDIITMQKRSPHWPENTQIWYFWARLESMLYSKMQRGKATEKDHIRDEVMTILTFDGSDKGWALFCKGVAPHMARTRGDTALESMKEFDKWKDLSDEKGFVEGLTKHLEDIQTTHHCNRLILPGISGGIPERVVCAECGRPMEMFFMYRCCVE